jgi:hypothetical protein
MSLRCRICRSCQNIVERTTIEGQPLRGARSRSYSVSNVRRSSSKKLPSKPNVLETSELPINQLSKSETDMDNFKLDLCSSPEAEATSSIHNFSLCTNAMPSTPKHTKPSSTTDSSASASKMVPDRLRSESNSHPERSVEDLDEQNYAAYAELRPLLRKYRDVHPALVPIDRMFKLYESLPGNRVCYLSRSLVRHLLFILSRQDAKLNSIARRYLMVIKDMQANGTTIRRSEWNGVVNVIGKGFNYETSVRTELVVTTVAEMERLGIKPDIVTLTTLFQSAVRSRNYELSDTIKAEMRRRGFENIIVWTERIKEAGLQKDPRKVHQVFEEFCAAGIPIDIALINTLLEAFLNAEQPVIAEVLYHRLRTFSLASYRKGLYPPIPDNIALRERRLEDTNRNKQTTGQIIQQATDIEHEISKRRIDPQDLLNDDGSPTELYKQIIFAYSTRPILHQAMVIPTRYTISLFIAYHCHYTGRMADVAFYLNELSEFGLPSNYGHYTHLLHGFFVWFGRQPDWDAERLDAVFSTIRQGVMNKGPPIRITYVLVLAAIRAFGSVTGGPAAREVWELLKPWVTINRNVRADEGTKMNQLEELVVAFERGGKLNSKLSGGDPRWKVAEWRNSTYTYS